MFREKMQKGRSSITICHCQRRLIMIPTIIYKVENQGTVTDIHICRTEEVKRKLICISCKVLYAEVCHVIYFVV
jgi:hypothetical protein